MLDAMLTVLLRLVIIIAAFGLLGVALLIRALVRRAYALSIRVLSGRNSDRGESPSMGGSVGSFGTWLKGDESFSWPPDPSGPKVGPSN